jgi:TPR repeat protein
MSPQEQKRIEQEVQISIGAEWAARTTAANALPEKIHYLKQALGQFSPLVEENIPRAALNIGVLAEHMAGFFSEPEEQSQQYQAAARYYQKAAAMADIWEDLSPAQAKVALAVLHERGLIGPVDFEKAFALQLAAAEAGFIEGQINVAIMYYRGEGVAQSLEDAAIWMQRAHALAVPNPAAQSAIADMLNEIVGAMARRPFDTVRPNSVGGMLDI